MRTILIFSLCLTFVCVLTQQLNEGDVTGEKTATNNDASAKVPSIIEESSTGEKTAETTGETKLTEAKEGGDKTGSANDDDDDDDDDELAGMDESLADYMLNLIKNSFKNNSTLDTTVQVNFSAPAQPKPEAPAESHASGEKETTKHTTPISLPTSGTTEDEYYYDYEDTTDYYDEFLTTPEPFSRQGQANCNVGVDLTHFCIFDELVEEYFEYDFTDRGLAEAIFDMDIVDQLKRQCPRGQWCLGDELQVLTERATGFYRGPFMDEDMWGCLLEVLERRDKCDDRNYMFVVDAADFLYNLFPDGEPEMSNEKRCFGHALAALHVTYADFLARNMTDHEDGMATLCDGEGYRMTKTYLCADDACDLFFEPREAMEKFSWWQWFMDNVNDVIQNCNLDNECGRLGQSDVTRTWFGMSSTTSRPEYDEASTTWYEWTPQSKHQGAYSAPVAENDENMIMALMVASAVGVIFMVLGLIFWRRNRRRSVHHCREGGYGKLASDEVGLLRGNASD